MTTPVITKEELFYTSEHLPHYSDHMFPPMEMDNTRYYIKPMNCPFHHTIFDDRPRSYRELPLKLTEYGVCHRYEDSGSLFGTMRVRAMWMNDAHIYCAEDQAVEEFKKVIKLHEYYYKILGINEYHMVLSLRNPENDKYIPVSVNDSEKIGMKARINAGGAISFYYSYTPKGKQKNDKQQLVVDIGR